MRILIKNGNVVTAVDNYFADILVEDGKVTVIGARLDMEADRVIDAADQLVIPGGIDPHTHMELPFGGTFVVRRFPHGHDRRGARRHDYDHRFRGAVSRRVARPGRR